MSADESGPQAASTIAAETERSKSFCVGVGRSREAHGGYCIWSSSFKGGSKLFKLLLQCCYDSLFMAIAGVRKPLQGFTINHSWAHNSHLLEQTRAWELIYTFKWFLEDTPNNTGYLQSAKVLYNCLQCQCSNAFNFLCWMSVDINCATFKKITAKITS